MYISVNINCADPTENHFGDVGILIKYQFIYLLCFASLHNLTNKTAHIQHQNSQSNIHGRVTATLTKQTKNKYYTGTHVRVNNMNLNKTNYGTCYKTNI